MNILISGYYGFGNAGDELILNCLISGIRGHHSRASITVLSANAKKTALHFSVNAINRWNPFAVAKALYGSDILISGGGGLFQDMTGNCGLYYYLAIIALARLLGKKIFVYGVGINELKKINRFWTTRVLSMADAITLRESYSNDLLKKWGCAAKHVEITADPVLENEIFARAALNPANPKVAMILRPPRKNDRYDAGLFAKLADSLIQRIGARIVFIPFHFEQDMPFTLSVMNSMHNSARLIQWSNARQLYSVIGEVDMVISQRLHGLILAALNRIPFLAISDDTKIDRFARELGQKNISPLKGANPYSLLAMIVDIWEWRDDFRSSMGKILPSFRLRARINPALLIEMMDSCCKK
ncbi:MAG: polysaccharide pyruvyl transferase CsaB [Elusimicrobia bacterium RIFOXYA2_FULL_50_26]|nr:MAG: polysaccharide pyruvyl transferase CsaB [Elusimicrobia bacterium RIFOXYA2_FULL_50_26]OGS22502.1 MAG: polysaccharide pyruvyl transferase CsaB [Elusimicrobia bacterium RIFOXYB2_FULL_50_12]